MPRNRTPTHTYIRTDVTHRTLLIRVSMITTRGWWGVSGWGGGLLDFPLNGWMVLVWKGIVFGRSRPTFCLSNVGCRSRRFSLPLGCSSCAAAPSRISICTERLMGTRDDSLSLPCLICFRKKPNFPTTHPDDGAN